MSRLADLLIRTDELRPEERAELSELILRLETSAQQGESIFSQTEFTMNKRLRLHRELYLGADWRVYAHKSGITGVINLNFDKLDGNQSLFRLEHLGSKVSVRTNLNFAVPAAITIAAGVISVTHTYTKVDTEGAAATDDLDTVNEAAGAGITGQLLILGAFNDARTVVVKDGTGNLQLAGDMSLDSVQDRIMLLGDSGNWRELARSNNA